MANAICHPERPNCSKGLCRWCSEKAKMLADPVYAEQRRASVRVARLSWYKRNPAANAARSRRDRRKIREAILVLFGGECVKCGFSDERALQIDHVNSNPLPHNSWKRGGVGLYRAILKGEFPKEDYQLLCANCNWIKRDEANELYFPPLKYKELDATEDSCLVQ